MKLFCLLVLGAIGTHASLHDWKDSAAHLSLLKRGPTPCTRNSQCASQSRPSRSDYWCENGECKWSCQAGLVGPNCDNCRYNSNCADSYSPENAYPFCGADGLCGWRCNRGFLLLADGKTCSDGTIGTPCTKHGQCTANLPENSTQLCLATGFCSFRCIPGYKQSLDKKSCVPIASYPDPPVIEKIPPSSRVPEAPTPASSTPNAAPTPASSTPQVPSTTSTLQNAAPTPASKLIDDYSAFKFFEGFQYFTWADPTRGSVNYVEDGRLAMINADYNVVLRVDNTKDLGWGEYRDSIRMTSNKPFEKNQLLVLDVVHMPTGCATWPAFWTVGPDWPNGGEIDIVEGVNLQQKNHYTLHSSNGCWSSPARSMTGTSLTNNCYAYFNDNVGCGIQDQDTRSYGAGLNAAGGGMYATLWTDNALEMWFFARSDIPDDLNTENPDPSKWGPPVASFNMKTTCNSSYFKPQTIVINTTLCGDWAGSVFGSSCPGSCADYIRTASNFNEAYWEFKSIRTYGPYW